MTSKNTSILFCYCVTLDEKIIARLRGSLNVQSLLDEIKVGNSFVQKALIYGGDSGSVPKDLEILFDLRENCSDFQVINERGSFFSLAKLRNAAIRLANKANFDWIVLCDCDTILFKNFQNFALHGKFCIPNLYWQKSKDESIWECASQIEKFGSSAFSTGNSWFMLHKDLFSKVDFNELIYGYGWEDIEFARHARSRNFTLYQSDAVIVHRYHDVAERNIVLEVMNRNKSVCEFFARQYELDSEICWRDYKSFNVHHPEWVSEMLVPKAGGKTFHLGKSVEGSVIASNSAVVIEWPGGLRERFLLNDAAPFPCLEFVDRI